MMRAEVGHKWVEEEEEKERGGWGGSISKVKVT